MDKVSIRERIDNGPISRAQIVIIAIGFILSMVDGFDVVAMSVASPALTADWQITQVEKGYILSAALVGMTLGAMFLGPLGDIYGRRALAFGSIGLIGLSMILTGLIPQSVPLMILIRVISGLGIGAIFANVTTIATEFAPERYRNLAVTLVIAGYPFGAMLVGPVAAEVIPTQGWRMLFIYGGVFTLSTAILVHFFLPESLEFLAARKGDDAERLARINAVLARIGRTALSAPPSVETKDVVRLDAIIAPDYRRVTLKLWTIYFMGFLSLYFLLSWIPSLFVNSGLSMREGIAALTIFNLSGVCGILTIGLIVTRVKLALPIATFFGCAALAMVFFYTARPAGLASLNALMFVIGFMIQGAFTAMYAVAARTYPAVIRSTGVGWAAGLGRAGAILSPIIAGYFVSLGWAMYPLFFLFAAPLLIAALLIATFKV